MKVERSSQLKMRIKYKIISAIKNQSQKLEVEQSWSLDSFAPAATVALAAWALAWLLLPFSVDLSV
jgi:hypothetical protein